MEKLTNLTQRDSLSNLSERQLQIKAKHPDCIVLIRNNGWYISIEDDAVEVSKTLGITLIKTQSGQRQALFPFESFDMKLHRLVKTGHRIAIVDLINS